MLKYFINIVFIILLIFNINIISFAATKTLIPKTHNVSKKVNSLKSKDNSKIIKKSEAPIQTMVVVDISSGKILHSINPKTRIHPASLVKLMTLYIAFEAIEQGRLKFNDNLLISSYASNMQPSKMGLPAGDYIKVKDAISSLIVGSHNDISVVIAENIAGSENQFSKIMNIVAKELGMNDTYFSNASGLHHDQQLTTSLDLVKLLLSIKRDHPKLYPLLSQTSFTFRGKLINGHNPVMKNYKYAKASKTGFTCKSGYNLITHATHKNKDIIAVVTGYKTSIERNKTMIMLLDKHLNIPPTLINEAVKSKSHSEPIKAVKNKHIKFATINNNKKNLRKGNSI